MYCGTGVSIPRASTWQYLQKPLPVLLIHRVSYSPHAVQYTVGPVHFRQGFMAIGLCQPFIKMLDLTALLTKDIIEPFGLTGRKQRARYAAHAHLVLHLCACIGNDTLLDAPLQLPRPEGRVRCHQSLRDGRHLLARMA